LAETLVTVAIIGILAAVALPSLGRVVPCSKDVIAAEVLETINLSVSKYTQIHGGELKLVVGNDASGSEEVAILRALQWVSPTEPDPGAPFMRTDYNPPISGNRSDHRLVWNGSYFELRLPGVEGTGLKVSFDGSDLKTPVVFASDFVPLSGL
jgi:type II secretory pathway pseudopilin PulG